MGSVIALTNLQLEHEQKAAFIDALGDCVSTGIGVARHFRSVMYIPMSYVDCENFNIPGGKALNVYVWLPPKSIEVKRKIVQNFQEVVEKFFGENTVSLVVIIKEHTDENVGVDGVLRWDVKQRATP